MTYETWKLIAILGVITVSVLFLIILFLRSVVNKGEKEFLELGVKYQEMANYIGTLESENLKLKARLLTSAIHEMGNKMINRLDPDKLEQKIFKSYVVLGDDNKPIVYLDRTLGEGLEKSMSAYVSRGFRVIPLTGVL